MKGEAKKERRKNKKEKRKGEKKESHKGMKRRKKIIKDERENQ